MAVRADNDADVRFGNLCPECPVRVHIAVAVRPLVVKMLTEQEIVQSFFRQKLFVIIAVFR